MLGSRIEEMLLVDEGQNQGTNLVNGGTASASSIPFIASNIAIINDETRQKQLLQEDEEEDFLDEGTYTNTRYNLLNFIFLIIDRDSNLNAIKNLFCLQQALIRMDLTVQLL